MISHELINSPLQNRFARFPYMAFAGLLFCLLSLAPAMRAQSQRAAAAIASDPAPDKENPAAMQTV
jgi:hypothetical protein